MFAVLAEQSLYVHWSQLVQVATSNGHLECADFVSSFKERYW